MSLMTSQRLAAVREAATVRARLALVPARATAAPRTPFVALVFGVLIAGVVGLLMFNTHMQQNAFAASDLQRTADALTAQQQQLNLELQHLRDPQRVAEAARNLGMVMPESPAFLRLSDGKVIGKAVPAGPDGALFVRNFKATKPPALKPKPRIVKVIASRASTTAGTAAGMKKAVPPSTRPTH